MTATVNRRARAGGSPFAALGTIERGSLYLLGLTSTLKAAALIAMATALATAISSLAARTEQWKSAVVLGVAAALLRAGVSWVSRVVATRTALGVKERLRADLAERLARDGAAKVGSQSTLATHGLDELDKYFTVYLPALMGAATVPLLVGARILFADWVSAVIIVLTVPLIPVFMALIGWHTQERVAAATDSLQRMSDHLVELARGLPVLVGLGRAGEQREAIRRISDDYRRATVSTLRTAFLSSLALELISTISVAVVAVFIGVRLVTGDLSLEVGLLALLLAAECYTPLREVGSAFHSAEEGTEALSRVTALIATPSVPSPVTVDPTVSGVHIDHGEAHYSTRAPHTRPPLTAHARPGQITLLDGVSGSGKSTLISLLAGESPPDVVTSGCFVRGTGPVAWLPQHPRTVADSVRAELELYRDNAALTVDEALERLALTGVADADPANISPGELRRVAFARVLLRISAGATIVLLDEPTAHLDAASARLVRREISSLAPEITVIVASHDPLVHALAHSRVVLGSASTESSPVAVLPKEVPAPQQTPVPHAKPSPTHPGSALRELGRFLRPVTGLMTGSVVLGVGAALFAVALTAVSAWLIVRASEQPSMMYLLVAIVGVRFFGIGRAVLRYSERLATHNAVFAALTSLRVRLWDGLAAVGPVQRSALTGSNTLHRLIRDGDQVRDLSLRVVGPIATAWVTVTAAVAALTIIQAEFLWLYLVFAVTVLVAAPAVALWADRRSSVGEQVLRTTVLRRFAALLGASADLRVNRVQLPVLRELRLLDASATRAARRASWALGAGTAVSIAACGLTAIAIIPLVAPAALSGAFPVALVAVLALTPLGLIDPLLDYVGAVQTWPALRDRLRSVAEVAAPLQSTTAPVVDHSAEEPPITSLELTNFTVRWPDAPEPVCAGVDAAARPGHWLVLTGPSGSGKSTLVTALLGHLPPTSGSYTVNADPSRPVDAAHLRSHIAWCPQEGHLFDSTVRANLLIAREREDAPDDQEMMSVLRQVGLGPLLDRLPDGLDTRIGVHGSRLSGGERQRVAVARTLLSRAEVIILDEPTAHLDEPGGAALIADLRRALSDHSVVLVTHHLTHLEPSDSVVRLTPFRLQRTAPQNVGGPA